MTSKIRLAGVSLLLLAGACEEGTVTGASTEEATTEVRVHGDAPEGGTYSRSPSSAAGPTTAEGSVEVEARVYLQTETGAWLELTDGAAAAQTVHASGSDGFQLLTRAGVKAQSYQRVRVEFERVQGEFSGGIAVGLGGGGGLVTVDVGSSGQITIERDVDLEASAGTVSHLDIDLNTEMWAGQAASSGVVTETAFANAVKVAGN